MRLRSVAQLLGFAISGLALLLVLAQVDLSATAEVLGDAQPLPMLIAFGALLVQFLVLALRWQRLLPVADGRLVPFRAVGESLLVGNLANAVLPARLGELARAVTISRRGAVDLAGSTGTVILERILDLTALAGVAAIAAHATGAPGYLTQSLALVAIAGALVVVVLALGVGASLVRRTMAWLHQRAPGPRLSAAVHWGVRLVDGLHAGERPVVLVLASLATVVSVLLDGVIFWAVARGLGIDLTWMEALLMGTAGVLVTGIPSAPANIGTFEFAVAWVGAMLGIPIESGLAIALVAHVIIVVPLSLGGGVVLLMALRRPAVTEDDRLDVVRAIPG